MLLKTCNRCKDVKDAGLFYANKRMKDGLNTFCIACHKADNVARKRRDRANPEFRAVELAYKKSYREQNKEKILEYMAHWREANRSRINQYGREYRSERREHYNFLCQKRKIDLLNRTPVWLTADDLWIIEEAYHLAALRAATTGLEWHVDHIVPLRGKRVSGLHVPLNLQVVPRAVNQRKTNKYDVLS